ncbi:MAG TPA: hypothetical protein VIL18_09930 [Longimicrobiales bacterium]
MRAIYEAGRQIRKVHFVMVLTFVVAVVGVASGIHVMKTYGLREADGGALKPLHVRLAFGGGLALAGLAVATGMAYYGRRYVARLEIDETTGEVHLLTLDLFGVNRLVPPREDLGRGSYHHGQMRGRVVVDAPWWTVPVRGFRVPFILDAQGTVHDEQTFWSLLRLRAPDRCEGERDLAARRSG